MRSVVITAYGGPENLAVVDREVPVPRPGNVVVEVEAAGLNAYDVIERQGGIPYQPPPPISAGIEGAGTVVAAASGVAEAALGQRVMWAFGPGSHAQFVEVPAVATVPLPPWLHAVEAAAVCAQGLTAHYLADSLRITAAGDTALVLAAAGGVGRLLTQLLVARGVRVIAAVSSDVKAEVALAAGAQRAVRYGEVEGVVKELTGGEGVDVVFDGVGAPTFDMSLNSVRHRGMLVVYGNSGGPIPPVDLSRFSGGSVLFASPSLHHFIASREELLYRANELFAAIERGDVTIRIDGQYPISNIADAHQSLESREVIGKVVVLPR